jgi:alpha-glucosidase
MKLRRLITLCCFALAAVGTSALPQIAAHAEVVRSPDGIIEVDFDLQDSAPKYSVRRFGDEVIRPSRLGFVLTDGSQLTSNFKIVSVDRNSHDETWTQPWGEKKDIRDHHNELRLTLEQQDPQARRLVVVFRVFNDGVGFRYEFPEQSNLDEIDIADEVTEFELAEDATAWWIPAFAGNRYEYLYQSSPVSQLRKVHTPVTFETKNGLCICIHEAALYDYAGMTLEGVGDRKLKTELVPWSDGVKVRTRAPAKTPWRTIQIGDNPGELITSYISLNLNEPNRLGDVGWIKPGKYVGVWWEMHLGTKTWGSGPNHGATTANTKRYIDFASKYGFDGVLVEGWNVGWDGNWYANGNQFSFTQPYPDFDIEGLATYAREKGVYLIGHHETSGGIANYERQLEDAYDLYERLGVRAVKSGYVTQGQNIQRHEGDRVFREWQHGQFMVRHYQHALEEAAKHHIMLVAHEPIKDTGIRRTFPNAMSREGARGQEYNAWDQLGGNPPDHTTILPFTRMLAGPMDFTPGVFDLLLERGDRPNNRVNTTLAKQLALYVVIYAPLQMAVDMPEVYEAHLDALQFIRDVPTDWEDTRVLHAKIGDYVTIVRKERDGDDWFLGSITDEVGRTLETPLDFLDRDRVYTAEVYRDADDTDWETNPTAYEVDRMEVDANTVLTLRLAPGGGQAIRFHPESQ